MVKISKIPMLLLTLLTVCIMSQPAQAETIVYVFDSDQSIVVKTGGFAGVHETYTVAGQFRLIVDSDASAASFEIVDANLTDETGSEYGRSLEDIFNMTGLAGTVVDDTTIEFEGKTADGTESEVRLKLSLEDSSAHLTGKTTPPPDSADMFFYDIDTVATKKYAGGTGGPDNPYLICTDEQMNAIGAEPNDWDKHFRLIADIDLSGFEYEHALIAPDMNDIEVGFQGISFTGIFDGGGHTISHLTIIGGSYLGLFGQLENGATISNLGLKMVDVEGTGFCVGGLVGENSGGITANCYTSGNISGSREVGGLMGYNSYGTVAYCYSTGTVDGESLVGGLVGWNDSEIMKCYAANKVLGNKQVGGLVGYSVGVFGMSSEITNSYFLAARYNGGPDNGHGFPLTEEQMKKPSSFFGWDFVGKPDGPHDIWAEPVEGGYPILWWQLSPLPELLLLNGKGESNDPYLISTADELNSIGHNPRLMAAYFKLINDIDLAGIDFFIIGSRIFPFTGVFDGNDHAISNFNHTTKYADVVGLFGYVKGPKVEIRNLGLISPNINWAIGDVGSLAGYFGDGIISNCYSDSGSVNGYYGVGGLVGSINGSITNCHSSTTVSGVGNVGGLVGSVVGLVGLNSNQAESNEYTGTISNCYSTGNVSGDMTVGGLVGINFFGQMTNCYSTATVDGNEEVGGLVGLNLNIIENCYSTGLVSGNETVGGLVGTDFLWGTVVDSCWDIETSGQTTSAGGEGKTTAEMQSASTFLEVGWDFVDETANGNEDIWWILEGQDYPRLWWEIGDETSP